MEGKLADKIIEEKDRELDNLIEKLNQLSPAEAKEILNKLNLEPKEISTKGLFPTTELSPAEAREISTTGKDRD